MTDETLVCRDCQNSFLFTTSEQEAYAAKGYTNRPSRCPNCLAARKERLAASGGGPRGGRGDMGRDRQMYPVVCGQCGKEAQVPFQPKSGRPVYCSPCFEAQRRGHTTW